MFRSVAFKIFIAVLLVSLSAVSANAAFVLPSDLTGTIGSDNPLWAPGFPRINDNVNSGVAPNNTVAFATTRSLVPWTRPVDNVAATLNQTTFQMWDAFFSGLPAGTEIDGAAVNPNGIASVLETTGNAFPTGGGNLYAPELMTAFQVTLPGYSAGPGYVTHVLLQVRASTGNIDVNSFAVNGSPVSGLSNYNHQVLNTTFYQAGQGPTAATDHKFEFTLPFAAASQTLTFASGGTGLSLDKLSIDTIVAPVPEPGMIGGIAVAGILSLFTMCRRMKAKA